MFARSLSRVAPNGLALGAVADFGTQNFQYTTNVDARQNVQLTTLPAIEPNACWQLVFYSSPGVFSIYTTLSAIVFGSVPFKVTSYSSILCLEYNSSIGIGLLKN